jgi:methyl-accepting chemotaxis protein
MFGGKMIKEAQEKIQGYTAMQEEQTYWKNRLQEIKCVSDEVFALLQVQDIQTEKNLKDITESLQTCETETEELAECAGSLRERLEELGEEEKHRREEANRWETLQEDGRKLAELAGQLKEIQKESSNRNREEKEEMSQVLRQTAKGLEGLQDAAKDMSVAALNAAIEAGRLGENGMGFLQTAENVRKLAETYSNRIAELEKQVSDFTEQVSDAKEEKSREQMERVLDEMAQRAEGFLREETTSGQMDLKEWTGQQKSSVGKISDGIARTKKRYAPMQEKLELLETNVREGKVAREELKEEWTHIFQGLKKEEEE